jgi:hypothetical protein
VRTIAKLLLTVGYVCLAHAVVQAQTSVPDADAQAVEGGIVEEYVPEALLVVCFAEGTSQDYIDEVMARVEEHNAIASMGARYFLAGRWPGSEGEPTTVRWSFAPDGVFVPSVLGEPGEDSVLFSRMDSLFSSQGGRSAWMNRYQQSFDRWQELSGVDFTRVTFGGSAWDDGASFGSSGSSTRGDIRLYMKAIDGPNGILGYNLYPSSGSGGDQVLDRFDSWGSASNENRFLRNVVMHELGHGIGIEHICSNNRVFLMEPFLNTNVDGPRLDDIRAAQRHYGDVYEPDNTVAEATDLGMLSDGQTLPPCLPPAPLTGSNAFAFSRCSIDASGENDWFMFSTPQDGSVTVDLFPTGSTYDDNPQNFNGSCSSGNSTDAKSFADLTLDLVDGDGSTVLITLDDNGKGVGELLEDFPLPAGVYFLRIYETGSGPSQTQLYKFTLTFNADVAPCEGDVDGDGDVDLDDLTLLLGDFGASGAGLPSDIDGDGNVDLDDLTLLLGNFGASCA